MAKIVKRLKPAVLATAFMILAPVSAGAQTKPPCAVGMPVAVLACINYPGHLVASDPRSGRYQVRCDKSGDKSWVSASDLKWNCVAAGPPAVTERWLLGRWSLFIGPTPHYEDRDSDRYLVVGKGAKGGSIEIRPNGEYRLDDLGKVSVGRWRVMAPAELKYGTKAPAILLMNGPNGMDWEMWKRDGSDDQNRDKATVEGMKLGLSYSATRVR